MLAKCWHEAVRVRWREQRATLCTNCGRLTCLNYRTGQLRVVWQGRRYGRKIS